MTGHAETTPGRAWPARAGAVAAAIAARADLAAVIAAAAAIALVAYTIAARFGYPHDLEWMTGSVLDHVERAQRGEPLYTAPSARWIPFLYPPLYAWTSALVAKALPLRLACRAVSVASTLVQAICVHAIARRHGATRTWAFVSVGVFFASYALVECWFDVERPDALFVALVAVAYVVLTATARAPLWTALAAGLLLGVAFFAKQPAIFFVAGATGGLCLRGEWKRAAALVAGAAAVAVPLALRLNASTGGWFAYYVLRMPGAHGVSLRFLPDLAGDLAKSWLFVAATAASALLLFTPERARSDRLFVAYLGAAFVASASSRLHVGGWSNVLVFWTTFASAAVGIVQAQIARLVSGAGALDRGVRAALALAVVAQIGGLAFDPRDRIPAAGDAAREDAFDARIHALEARGEVLVLGRGHTTTPRHFHTQALIDVLYLEKRVPDAVIAPMRDARYAAIVVDGFDDLWLPQEPAVGDALFRAVVARYAVAERIDPALPLPVVGWKVHPSWVLVPREKPLDPSSFEALLRAHLAEIAVAEMREGAGRRGVDFGATPPSTEALGAEVVERVYAGARAR